ncbi:4'-phosphopantetheinyl transferase family protein [Actinomadura madurae]|uniref:4'-phosphopantetheinyl transferase family protein n=1 Tax=Actinomadura madurae TaxID=1993 RepID=UPI0020D20F33|nr:4'-phosphopantetheinyl transferase superfamily protein [Actinomadura madurae]MCQ0005314.1 4'-phosphopantetheinyl transferase superfamily protein [Actinomadura madurae]
MRRPLGASRRRPRDARPPRRRGARPLRPLPARRGQGPLRHRPPSGPHRPRRGGGLAPESIRFTTGCPHCGGTHGKPRLPGSDLDFSLSHSGDRVVLVLAEGAEVGVDVERESDRDIDRLAEMVLTAAERDALTAMADRRRGFHTYWSRKEALLKATGHGLAAPMTSIHVSAPDEPAAVVAWDGEAAVSPVRLTDLTPGPGYAAAAAVLTDRPLKVTEVTY